MLYTSTHTLSLHDGQPADKLADHNVDARQFMLDYAAATDHHKAAAKHDSMKLDEKVNDQFDLMVESRQNEII